MMGIPVEQDLAAQTILDRTGVGGKSGTWLREIVTRAAKPVHDKNYAKKVALLKDFGLMDEDDHSTSIMTDGHFDEQKMLHILRDKLKDIPVEEKAKRIAQVFGERGSMGIALLTEDKMLKQYDDLLAESHAILPNAEFWKQQNSTNEMQRLRGAAVEAQVAALNAGKIIAPFAVGAAEQASSVLGWAADYLPKPDTAGERHLERSGAWALGGAALGGTIGAFGGPPEIVAGSMLGSAIFGGAGYLAEVTRSIFEPTERGTEKGAAAGTEKGITAGLTPMMGGLMKLLESLKPSDNKAALGLSDYGTGSSAGTGSLLASGPLGGNSISVGGTPVPSGGGYTIGGVPVPTGPGGGPFGSLPTDKRKVAQIAANAWRAAGMSDAGIAGLMANINEESGFKPWLRHADQPHYGGEAHFAHGLYQEGGAEWLHYAAWLGKNYPGSDWRDPKLQSEFAAWNLKTNYPAVWNRMAHGSKEQAAAAYAAGYLKPAARYLASRLGKFGHGVPGLPAYVGSEQDNVSLPPKSGHAITLSHQTVLDGQILAKNTTKYITKFGQHPAAGARLPDYSGTRPYTIGGD